MKFPINKGFDLSCGLVITVFLDDCETLTGTFLGEIQEQHRHKRLLDDLHEFILIQLTCPSRQRGGPEIPEGTFCAINVNQIKFITPGIPCHDKHDKCHDKKHDDACIISISRNSDDDTCEDK